MEKILWAKGLTVCKIMPIFASEMSITRFLKDWTLPIAMTTGSSLYLLFANVGALAGAAAVMAPVCDRMLPVFMFLVLFITFCKVDFRKMRLARWHILVCVFQTVLAAALVGLSTGLELEGDSLVLLEATLCCIIAPVASAAAVVTQKVGGDLESMTSFTFLSNLMTAILIPTCFPLVDKTVEAGFVEAFVKIFREVCMVIVVPMGIAYVVKHYLHRLHRRIVSVRDLSYYMWACSLMLVTGTTVRNICHASATAWFISAIALSALIVCIAQFAIGRYIGHFFGNTVDAGQALGQKNTAFAIWTANTYLSPLSSVGPGCYILWQNIINSVEIWKYGKDTITKNRYYEH